MASAACSVIIVGYRSRPLLERCLPSVLAEDAARDIIVVDNHSDDGTLEWLTETHPQVKVLANPVNAGYGAACNQGWEAAREEYGLILNPDTVLVPGALEQLLATAASHPDALINPVLLQPDETVNAYGNRMHLTGIASCEGLGETWSDNPPLRYPLLASGAAILTRRAVWNRLGGFDPDYFLYFEDTDLSLRAQLLGIPVICDTRARIIHAYALNLTPMKFFLLERNRLMTLLTVYQRTTLRKLLLPLLLMEMATWAYALTKGPAYLFAIVRGYGWLWAHRSALREKRRRIQAARVASDQVILTRTTPGLPFDQLIPSGLARLLSRATAPLFHGGRAL